MNTRKESKSSTMMVLVFILTSLALAGWIVMSGKHTSRFAPCVPMEVGE